MIDSACPLTHRVLGRYFLLQSFKAEVLWTVFLLDRYIFFFISKYCSELQYASSPTRNTNSLTTLKRMVTLKENSACNAKL